MNILAFDTSSSMCLVALKVGDKINHIENHVPMQQAKFILPMINELLHSFSLTLYDLNGIAYGCGPGSFTGTRIASSVAQGLGFAIKKPLLPISFLASIAQTVYIEQQWGKQLVALDAGRGKIYWGIYTVNQTGIMQLVGKEELTTPFGVNIPDGLDFNKVGNGWTAYKEIFDQRLEKDATKIYDIKIFSPKALIQLGCEKLESEEWVSPSNALPIYLSGNDL